MDMPIFLIDLMLGIGFGLFLFGVPLLALAALVLAAIASDGRGFLLNLLSFISFWVLLVLEGYWMFCNPWLSEASCWPFFGIPVGLLSSIAPVFLLRSALREKNRWETAEHLCSLLAVAGETVAVMLICYCARFH